MTCEEARCQFQQTLIEDCSCDQVRNHGQFVRCVAHAVKQLADNDQIPRRCKGKLKRCAARSVCGKQDRGFVTCLFHEFGTCLPPDTVSGTSVCEHDPAVACTTNADCIVSTKCRTKRGAEKCEARGGVVGTAPTCCSNCTTEG